MFTKKFILAAVCVLFAMILFATSACGRNGNLKISVQDSAHNALWGAKVVSESQPTSQLKIDGITSEEAGGVLFNGIKAGTYRIQVSRYGFAPETIDADVSRGKTESVIVVLFYASPPPPTT